MKAWQHSNNMLIYSNYFAKDIQNSMSSNQYCICVFLKDNLMEKYILMPDKTETQHLSEGASAFFIQKSALHPLSLRTKDVP